MKKIINLFLIMLMALSLFGCTDPKDTKAQITDKNGNNLELSVKEIIKLTENDDDKFYKTYYDGTAKISGTVEKVIEGDEIIQDSTMKLKNKEYRVIYLKEGWAIRVIQANHPETELLVPGDKIVAKGSIESLDDGYILIGRISFRAGYGIKIPACEDNVEVRILD